MSIPAAMLSGALALLQTGAPFFNQSAATRFNNDTLFILDFKIPSYCVLRMTDGVATVVDSYGRQIMIEDLTNQYDNNHFVLKTEGQHLYGIVTMEAMLKIVQVGVRPTSADIVCFSFKGAKS